ncbi:hypothetical protein [Streptomyces jumonjinensis]|uniref:hypothetical protein n=1 Tax=Streptomyces jumonjinensis TaxID=1945 RepID=UPI0037B0507C
MKRRFDNEPPFFVLDYITITRDPRTRLVIAISGDDRAAGILQTSGRFLPAPGPRGDYHRQPHDLPVEDQCRGATAAAHALLTAGFSVHLDPTLNTLLPPDGDREFADVLTEIVAPSEELLPRLTSVLTTTWAVWHQREDAAERTTPSPTG